MSLFFGTTEITKLRDLAPQTGLDITDLWFGSTNVYTVWQTYEGTLPATLNANGDDMRQYQVYGATGGVGDKTVNYHDGALYKGVWTSSDFTTGGFGIDIYRSTKTYLPAGTYTICFGVPIYLVRQLISGGYSENSFSMQTYTFTTEADGYVGFSFRNTTNTAWDSNPTTVMIVEGTTPPETFVPFGYEVDMGVKSGNVMPSAPAETKTSNGITITCDGEGRYSISGTASSNSDAYINFYFSEFTPPVAIGSGGNGAFFCFNNFSKSFSDLVFQFFKNDGKIFETSFGQKDKVLTSYSISAINRFRIYVRRGVNVVGDFSLMFTDGGTASASYQPYSNDTTPIYIGSDPLEKDEYVDYQAGKIYRMIDGALTPTDPPVPLPALPTCDGETIVDYAGSGTAPEKVLLRYRKEGF